MRDHLRNLIDMAGTEAGMDARLRPPLHAVPSLADEVIRLARMAVAIHLAECAEQRAAPYREDRFDPAAMSPETVP
ncbi:MAG: hypothetical protein KF817_08000 [Phycisphaeraceae bacterium]|nr:hypothetical protein [Phycisphaeraceae bacterium]